MVGIESPETKVNPFPSQVNLRQILVLIYTTESSGASKVPCSERTKHSGLNSRPGRAGIAQLVSARPSELEVHGSILGDSNVCFDVLQICVALTLNTLKTEH